MKSSRSSHAATTDTSDDSVLLLCRHGETDFNARGVLQGQLDVPLNQAGELQAARLGSLLPKIIIAEVGCRFATRAYTSDLQRAALTARIALAGGVAGGSLAEVVTDQQLRERRLGPFEGLSEAEAVRSVGAELARVWRGFGGSWRRRRRCDGVARARCSRRDCARARWRGGARRGARRCLALGAAAARREERALHSQLLAPRVPRCRRWPVASREGVADQRGLAAQRRPWPSIMTYITFINALMTYSYIRFSLIFHRANSSRDI